MTIGHALREHVQPSMPGGACERCKTRKAAKSGRWVYCAACWRILPDELNAVVQEGRDRMAFAIKAGAIPFPYGRTVR